MDRTFQEIHENETNENTAIILMLSVLGEKLTDIATLLKRISNLSTEILTTVKTQNNGLKMQNKVVFELKPEDYME